MAINENIKQTSEWSCENRNTKRTELCMSIERAVPAIKINRNIAYLHGRRNTISVLVRVLQKALLATANMFLSGPGKLDLGVQGTLCREVIHHLETPVCSSSMKAMTVKRNPLSISYCSIYFVNCCTAVRNVHK